jgi:hypothetical protein
MEAEGSALAADTLTRVGKFYWDAASGDLCYTRTPMSRPRCTIVYLAFCLFLLLPSYAANKAADKGAKSSVTVSTGAFHGWKATILRNKAAQVVIVPAIGRIMNFDLLDAKGNVIPGPFWNNPGLGEGLQPDSRGWKNYGGDKAWPERQADWPAIEHLTWPPPPAFDASPYEQSISGAKVQIVSPVDEAYGVRVRRTISLDPHKPVMTVQTTYEKVQGPPVQIGVWTITQSNSPDRAFILIPQRSALPQGYTNLLRTQPKDLRVDGRLLSVVRELERPSMIGSDGNALLWVGNGPDLLIENKSPEPTGKVEWPESGSHTKIYTSPGDRLKYVELELLNPIQTLKTGESSSMESTYTLIRRSKSDPLAEAKKVFRQK